jgi:SAM-dependent methyltransferase
MKPATRPPLFPQPDPSTTLHASPLDTAAPARPAASLHRWFAGLPLRERLFVRARTWTAPLAALAAWAPDTGRIADIGCGHGALSALLASEQPRRQVLGVDPDERKIAWALRGPARLPNVEFRVARIEDLLPFEAGVFDAVVVADVLYLLPLDRWPAFLADCRRLLRPGGVLLLKEVEADGSWKFRKGRIQERLMVNVIGKTLGSGGMTFLTRERMGERLRESGFRIRETVGLSRGYSTPHVLFVAAVDTDG